MAGNSRGSTPVRGGIGGVVIGTCRVIAWAALLGVTGLLVRAEVERPTLPRGVVAYTDLVYQRDGHGRARLDVYTPAGAAPARGRPAVLAVHGGGWRGGSKRGYGQMAAALVEHGYVVVAVDYRLSRRARRAGRPTSTISARRFAGSEGMRPFMAWIRTGSRSWERRPAGTWRPCSRPARKVRTPARSLVPRSRIRGSQGPGYSTRVQAVIDFYGPSDLPALAAKSQQRRPRSLALTWAAGPTMSRTAMRLHRLRGTSRVTPRRCS